MNDDGDYMHEAVIRGIGIGDGGQAFPIPDNERYGQTWGMSLRDYFAAQALTGLLHIGAEPKASPRVLAEYAYKFADAMLAHRAAAAERGEGQ
jgi:hypothetical protein